MLRILVATGAIFIVEQLVTQFGKLNHPKVSSDGRIFLPILRLAVAIFLPNLRLLSKLVILTRTGRYFWPVHMSRRVWPVQPVRGCVNLLRTGQDLWPVHMSRRVRPVQPVTHWQAYIRLPPSPLSLRIGRPKVDGLIILFFHRYINHETYFKLAGKICVD